jgi:hypothetical protein
VHDGLVQNMAAALLLLSTVDAMPASAARLDRSIEIVRAAFATGRREVISSLEPIDRPLKFTLSGLLEQSGTAGRVHAPRRRYPRDAELAVFHAVQDTLLLSEGGAVDVRVSEADEALATVIRATTHQLELLVDALDHRLGLHGGEARPLRRGRGVALRVPLAYSV